MKKNIFLPVIAVLSGVAALAVRLLQNRSGFEVLTGLPIRSNAVNYLLPACLLLSGILLLLSARRFPKEQPQVFPQGFQTESPALLTLVISGIFLIGISGALEFCTSLGIVLPFSSQSALIFLNDQLTLRLNGIMSLLSAFCLFPAAAACRKHENDESGTVNGTLLLIPVICLVVRLVLVYRIQSVNPVLASYYVELLAMVLITLGFYRLSSFAYRQGNPRIYAFYVGAATVLSAAHVGDGLSFGVLLYLGYALTLLAFLLLMLQSGDPAETISQSPEDDSSVSDS